MTKSERLIFLVNLIKQRRIATVEEMSLACGVSHRTIYRDMLSLSRMSVPLYYDNGYRLARESGFPFQDLSGDDIDLVIFTLRNNPLGEFPYFRRRFHALEHRILQAWSTHHGGNHSGENRMFIDRRIPPIPPTPEVAIVERFLRAILERRKVGLSLGESVEKLEIAIPVAVRVTAHEMLLIVLEPRQSRPRRIPLNGIAELHIREERFDPDQLEQIRRRLHQLKKELTGQQ